MPYAQDQNQNKHKETVISQNILFKSKEWLYGIIEKVGLPNDEARELAFNTILIFECLLLKASGNRIPLSTHYLQLYALVALNTTLQAMPTLRQRCPAEKVMSFGQSVYSPTEFSTLQTEVNTHDVANILKSNLNEISQMDTLVTPSHTLILQLNTHKPLDHLELFLKIFPQTSQIRNVALILLDAFHLQFFVSLSDARKVAFAAVAVSRFWVEESEEIRWTDDYVRATGLTFNEIKNEYDQVYCLAYAINQRNLAKKREEEARKAAEQQSIEETPAMGNDHDVPNNYVPNPALPANQQQVFAQLQHGQEAPQQPQQQQQRSSPRSRVSNASFLNNTKHDDNNSKKDPPPGPHGGASATGASSKRLGQ